MAVVNAGDDPALARKSYRRSAQIQRIYFTSGNGRIRSLKNYRKKITDMVVGDSPDRFTDHDLRRILRNLTSIVKVDYHIQERCLGHIIGVIVDVNDQFDYFDEKREAFELLADELRRITND